MRVISQDGRIDVPYEQVVIQHFNQEIYFLNKNLTGVDSLIEDIKIATYSTEEKAEKAMEMLREAYCNNEFYHHTATTNTFQETMGLLSSEKFKEVTNEYFRFPQDDEIEV